MNTLTVERIIPAIETLASVRQLHPRTGHYFVTTPVFSAYLGSMLVHEQFDKHIDETVAWALALFDAHTTDGQPASTPIATLGDRISDFIESRIEETDELELKLAMEAVNEIIERAYGKKLRISGWMPGQPVIGDGRAVLELSGHACPRCAVNPTGFRPNDKGNIARCLNSEECGWIDA